MSQFRNILISCQQCGRKILVKPADTERGEIICTHKDCGATNRLETQVQYDDRIVEGLPSFGSLVLVSDPTVVIPLRYGPNVLGTSAQADGVIPRLLHEGRCFISRRHCTLSVAFDRWKGELRYQLQDGATDPESGQHRASLNGTRIGHLPLKPGEIIDIPHDECIGLGGIDSFRLTPYRIASAMLETYQIRIGYNPEQTE